ncbi:uncharacterized protein BXZ73DRAFT_102804 [Epithele typhae]|uniref:uncharacterized protein n=1 Tax=Epithele typhae TaxID=378194 RepID=UPI00200840B1|nr:uncharacterized protein BXZ73DRAFT_102804 [Epithele typhae]KAH9926541.1 hypothetical protein BXZ73DRAFT_102804 [Epithele typhae]
MWLLGTARANLVFFPQPEKVPGGYAILSHTWLKEEEGEEETFQKVQRLNVEANSPFSPEEQRPFLRAELRSLISQAVSEEAAVHRDELRSLVSQAELAEQHGHKYAWVDTCCINKESSSELSEGINSMFRYYALSTICYVYLSDHDSTASVIAELHAPTFSMSPDGIELRAAVLPLDDTNRFLLVDLFCRDPDGPVFLLLERVDDGRSNDGAAPLYQPEEQCPVVCQMTKPSTAIASHGWMMTDLRVVALPPYTGDLSECKTAGMERLKRFCETTTTGSPFHLAFRDFLWLTDHYFVFSDKTSTLPSPSSTDAISLFPHRQPPPLI